MQVTEGREDGGPSLVSSPPSLMGEERWFTHPDSRRQNMSVEVVGPTFSLLELLSDGSNCMVVSSLSIKEFKERLEQHQGLP